MPTLNVAHDLLETLVRNRAISPGEASRLFVQLDSTPVSTQLKDQLFWAIHSRFHQLDYGKPLAVACRLCEVGREADSSKQRQFNDWTEAAIRRHIYRGTTPEALNQLYRVLTLKAVKGRTVVRFVRAMETDFIRDVSLGRVLPPISY